MVFSEGLSSIVTFLHSAISADLLLRPMSILKLMRASSMALGSPTEIRF
jgi:hypothetical protein